MTNREHNATDEDLELLTNLFRLLSDKTRLNLVMLLGRGERNVTSLCKLLHLPQPTVSHHLGLLRLNNITGNRRSGKEVYYTLNGRVNTRQEGRLVINVGAHEIVIQRTELTDSFSTRPVPHGGTPHA